MSSWSNSFNCQVGTLAMGGAAGALAFVLLMLLGGWTFWAAVLAAVVIAGALWLVLAIVLCAPLSGPVEPGTAGRTPGDVELSLRARRVAEGGAVPAAAAQDAAASGEAATTEGAGDDSATPESDKGVETASMSPDPTPAKAAAGTASDTATEAADAQVVAKDVPATTAGTTEKTGHAESDEDGTKPVTLSAPRDGKADNLKEIKGVGPKLEELLHEMGFYHFDQIANWSADEVAWVNANLTGFKGRVTRDDWVNQAKILASGEDTEFSKRVDKGDVY